MNQATSTLDQALSPVEKIFWRLAQGKLLNVASVAEVEGELTHEAVKIGLSHVAKLHPLSRVRIEENGATPTFVSKGVPDIPLREVDEPAAGFASVLEQELNLPFDTGVGPLVRCTWVTSNRQRHRIFMTFHHAVGDGMSGVYLLRDFLQAAASHLAGKSLPESSLVEHSDAVDFKLPAHAKGIRGAVGVARLLSQVAWEDIRLRPASRPQAEFSDDSSTTVCRVDCRVVESEHLVRITEQARKHETTVHGALSAAICLAIANDHSATKAMSIKHRSPVNMRSRLDSPVGEQLGMFASMSFHRDRITGDDDFWTLARSIRKTIETQIARYQPALLLQLLPLIYQNVGGDRRPTEQVCQKWQQRTVSTTGLTNLGRLEPFRDIGPLKVGSVQFAFSPGALGDFACTAATYGETLCWNFVYSTPHFSIERATRIADDAVERLYTAIE